MPGSLVHVRKEGKVFTIFVDDNRRPVTLAGPSDAPVGAAPMTYTSARELQAALPGCTFKFHETILEDTRAVVRSGTAVHEKYLARDLKKNANFVDARAEKVEQVEKRPRLRRERVPLPAEAIQTPPAPSTNVLKVPDTPPETKAFERAEQFRKRLEVALQYASKKNQRTLDIQIKVVQELIDEVFGASEQNADE